MKSLLVVAATANEIAPLINYLGLEAVHENHICKSEKTKNVSILVTGVGMVNTAFSLATALTNNKFDLIINAGICGALDRRLKIGETVVVKTDTLSEMGAEDGDNFITYSELGLGGANAYSAVLKTVPSCLENLPVVSGITVNKVHGSDKSINEVKKIFNAAVESMEGASFFRVCGHYGVEYFQLRSVSNYVEKRDKSKWDIAGAVKNLNNKLIEVIKGDI